MKITINEKPLSVNDAFQGRRYKTRECKAYEETLFPYLRKVRCVPGCIAIEYRFYLRRHGLCDYDNCIKILQDALVRHGCIEDDRKIYKATIYKIPSETDRIEIDISPYREALDRP